MTPPSYGHFDFVFLLLARHSMHALPALAASVGSPKTGEEYSGQRSIVEPLRPSDTSPKTGEEYMRTLNFILHTKTWQPTYCPPVLGGRAEGGGGYSLHLTPYSLFNRKGSKNISYITTFFKKIGIYPR